MYHIIISLYKCTLLISIRRTRDYLRHFLSYQKRHNSDSDHDNLRRTEIISGWDSQLQGSQPAAAIELVTLSLWFFTNSI